jgi:predicted dienelactone hydrolase
VGNSTVDLTVRTANQGRALMSDLDPATSLTFMSLLDRLLVAVALVAGLWWALSRMRRPAELQRLSAAALALAVATLVFDRPHWQMVPWQVLAVSVGVAAALRRWRPGHSHRSLRVIGRGALGVGLVIGGLALLTAFVPSLPKPSGPHRVGSHIFRWTDNTRAETLTPDPSDHRQVIAQAWYPTETTSGRAVPYFEAQDKLPGSVGGLPSFMYASFGEIATHATFDAPVSPARPAWPVLVFSSGLSVPREAYTALCADLASRGYVVIALSTPYESAPTVLAGGQVVGQTAHPDVMGPAPHPELERLIDIRAADSSFVLDQLTSFAKTDPSSPLAGHLDLHHVGIVGHSLGGATTVQTMAADARFKVGVNLDGKLFGTQPDAHLKQPLLWIQSDGGQTDEYTQGRDRLLGGLRDGGSLVTVRGSVHMSFSDEPSYWTAAGRSSIGSAAGVGSISVAEMTAMTGDTISAFVAPALGVANAGTEGQVLDRHTALRLERQIASVEIR